MQLFDDSIPEEIEPSHAVLVSMLRQASAAPLQLSAEEQAQLLARVQQRLQSPDLVVSARDEQAAQPIGATDSIPPKKAAPRLFPIRQGNRAVRFVNVLAAVLLIAIIAGFSLLLFRPHQGPIIGSVPPSTQFPPGMTTVDSTAGGFEMTLSLTQGPYFLSELLAAQISLTNHTGKTAYVGFPFVGSACGYVTGIQVTGEDNPQFVIPIPTDHSCPPLFNDTAIKPGQTLTVVKYLPLTNSGHLILTAETEFYTSAFQPPNLFPKQIAGSFDAHWPSMQINVAPKVPANRMISYSRVGPRVFIHAAQPVQYLYAVACSDYTGQGGTGSGNYGWQALTKNVVGEPGCPGKNVQWTFAFGLPGYAIAQGSVTFPGNDPNP